MEPIPFQARCCHSGFSVTAILICRVESVTSGWDPEARCCISELLLERLCPMCLILLEL